MPNVDIDYQMGGETMRCGFYGSQYKTTVSDLKHQLEKSTVTATNFPIVIKPKTPATSVTQSFKLPEITFSITNQQPSNNAITSVLPEITLSITKQDGFLLITFSPFVTNANLEQANVNSYPWAWD